MNRRKFIATMASASIITAAGCASSGEEESDSASGSSDGDGSEEEAEGEGVEILEHEVVEPDIGSYIEIHGKVQNNTGQEQDYIEIEGIFYNADEERVGDTWTNVTDVPDGEVVQFELTPTVESSEFEEYELSTSTSAL